MSIFIDVNDLPLTFAGLIQVSTLGMLYGYGLFYAANLISDGSELLLLVPSFAGLVGSVILPILGAVPDGMMVLFSGLGENAQEEISVGVGALAGSTIMLLTVPWFMSIVAGRVNIDEATGQCIYKGKRKLPNDGLFEYKLWKNAGVKISPEISKAAHIMILTMGSYVLIQLPSLFHMGSPLAVQAGWTRPMAFFTFLVCVVAFCFYLYYSYRLSTEPSGENDVASMRNTLREDFIIKAIGAGKISLVGVMQAEFEFNQSLPSVASTTTGAIASSANDETNKRLRRVIDPFFQKYDVDKNGTLDVDELGRVFADMGENVSHKALMEIFKTMDSDGNGTISIGEFFVGVVQYISKNSYLLKRSTAMTQGDAAALQGFQRIDDSESGKPQAADGNSEGEEGEDEEDDEMPEDLVDLPAYEQQRRIKIRAAFLTLVGTAIVLLLSDPMVDVLASIGKRTGISPFYISFIFAPIASNASEVIASYAYALKKTSTSMAISLTQLEGAAIMNNTFGESPLNSTATFVSRLLLTLTFPLFPFPTPRPTD